MESLSEKYLEYISKKFRLSKPKAASYIDKCLKQTAVTYNMEYNVIYNNVFTETFLEKCLLDNGTCNKKTIDECKESCNCVYMEEYGCLPRKIKDADKINKDPDKYIKENLGKTEDLKKTVKIAAYLYYNYDGGGLTDNAYDALEYYLKKKEKLKGRLYEKIGAPPVKKIRTNLPYPMPSLRKVKPGTHDLTKFLENFDEVDCVWSEKLDGVSGMIIYDKLGKLKGIYTRGDGQIGGNVTYLKDYLKSIPKKVSKEMVVRGEFILSKDIWKSKYQGSYSNARSFVSGKINSGFASPALPDVLFIAYELMRYDNKIMVPEPSRSFKILDAEEFKVVEYGLLKKPTVFDIMELYKKKRDESGFFIDGLVITSDQKRLGAKPGIVMNPLHTMAFKMQLQAQLRSTKIINLDWNISRYGRYVPVAIYESVYVDGVRMHRATAHNARHIQDWNMGKGTKIKVIRSGDVIPQIKDVEVNPNIVPIFPKTYDEGGYEWHWERSDIILDEIENNKYVQIKRSLHFFKTIGIKGIGPKKIEYMWDIGLISPEKIIKASIKELAKTKTIGVNSATKFHESIRETMRHTPPDRFIVASTTFKSGVGRKLLKKLFMHIPNILYLSSDEIRNELVKKKIKGFGPARIRNISENIPKFRDYLDSFAKKDVKYAVDYYIEQNKEIKKKGYNPRIKGKKFVLTGFMMKTDYELEDYIYSHKGDFASTVTSDVEAVISANVLDITKKMIAASKFNIPVLNVEEFSKRFNVPLKRFENRDEEDF